MLYHSRIPSNDIIRLYHRRACFNCQRLFLHFAGFAPKKKMINKSALYSFQRCEIKKKLQFIFGTGTRIERPRHTVRNSLKYLYTFISCLLHYWTTTMSDILLYADDGKPIWGTRNNKLWCMPYLSNILMLLVNFFSNFGLYFFL